jgi:hypothetical protein
MLGFTCGAVTPDTAKLTLKFKDVNAKGAKETMVIGVLALPRQLHLVRFAAAGFNLSLGAAIEDQEPVTRRI